MTAIDFLCGKLGASVIVAPIAVLVAISNIGAASAYLSATARLPFVAGVNRYLPPVFGRVHPRWKTPWSLSFRMDWREFVSDCWAKRVQA